MRRVSEMKNLVRVLIVVLLGLSVTGCELFSPKFWQRVDERSIEKGEKCYRRADGNMYCKDKYGNRTY